MADVKTVSVCESVNNAQVYKELSVVDFIQFIKIQHIKITTFIFGTRVFCEFKHLTDLTHFSK